jgi:hypothetical protein
MAGINGMIVGITLIAYAAIVAERRELPGAK